MRGSGVVFAITDDEPRHRAYQRWIASAVLGFACFMAVVALLVITVAARPATPDAAPAVPAPPVPVGPHWVEISHPFTTYDLSGGPYAKLPLRYEARREEGGAGRQDTVTYGAMQPGEAFLRMLFERHGTEPATDATLFVDAARLAAGAGLAITHSGLPWSLATRFGPFETADVTASRADQVAPCVAFRRSTPILSITGLLCGGADAKTPGPVALACTLDKLDLMSAGDDGALSDLFLVAERQRGLGCVDARTARLLSDDPLRPVDAALRGSLPLGGGPNAR